MHTSAGEPAPSCFIFCGIFRPSALRGLRRAYLRSVRKSERRRLLAKTWILNSYMSSSECPIAQSVVMTGGEMSPGTKTGRGILPPFEPNN